MHLSGVPFSTQALFSSHSVGSLLRDTRRRRVPEQREAQVALRAVQRHHRHPHQLPQEGARHGARHHQLGAEEVRCMPTVKTLGIGLDCVMLCVLF